MSTTSNITTAEQLLNAGDIGRCELVRGIPQQLSCFPMKDPITIEAFQRHIHDRYFKPDSARGTAATFLWFMEEVGELATALQRADAAPSDNLAEEFADVLAWLCTLANINGVDLTEAVRRKYLEGGGPAGHK